MPYMLVGVDDAHVQPSYRPLTLGTFQISSHFIANVIWDDGIIIYWLFFLPEPTTQPAPPFIARRMNAKAPVHSFALNVQRFGFPLPVAGLG